MTQFIDKFRNIEAKVAKKFGEFVLFGLFLPEDAPKWDLVMSATWLKRTDVALLKSISQILNQELGEDIIKLSKFVVLEPTDAFVRTTHAVIHVKNGISEFVNCEFNGLQIKHAFIITSQKKAHDGLSMKTRSKEERVPA